MSNPLVEVLAALLAGTVVAILGTPAGVSGAVFLLPVQISVLNVAGPAVSATNLLYNILSTPLALRRLKRSGAGAGLGIVAVGIPAATLGALARVTVLSDPTLFRLLLAAVLLPLGGRLLWRARRHTNPAPHNGHAVPMPMLIMLAGLAAAIGASLGVGGGSLLAPVLVGLLHYPGRPAAVLALTTTLTTSLTGLIAYTVLDLADIGAAPATPYWLVGVPMGIGGMIGGLIGTALQPRLSDRLLTAILGSVATATAVSYLLR